MNLSLEYSNWFLHRKTY